MTFSDTSIIGKVKVFLAGMLLFGIGILAAFHMVITGQINPGLVAVMLLFGGLGGALLFHFFWPTFSGDFERRQIQHHGHPHEALVVPVSRTRSVVMMGGLLGLAGPGAILIVQPMLFSPYRYGYPPGIVQSSGLVMVALGIFALVGLSNLFRKPKDIVLFSDGIRLPSIAGGNFVPWKAIESVSLHENYLEDIHNRYLRISIRDRTALELSTWEKIWLKLYIKSYHIDIPIHSVGVSGDELKAIVARLSHDPDERTRLWHIQQYSDTVPDSTELNEQIHRMRKNRQK